jgi:hypothetical protein
VTTRTTRSPSSSPASTGIYTERGARGRQGIVPASRSVAAGPVELVVTTFSTTSSAPSSAADHRARGEPASPGSPQYDPAGHSQAPALPSLSMVRRRGVGESWIDLARRAWDPAPRRGPADLRRQVGMHTARPLSRAGKVPSGNGHGSPISGTSFLFDPRQAPFRVRASYFAAPSRGAPLRGYRPASEEPDVVPSPDAWSLPARAFSRRAAS